MGFGACCWLRFKSLPTFRDGAGGLIHGIHEAFESCATQEDFFLSFLQHTGEQRLFEGQEF